MPPHSNNSVEGKEEMGRRWGSKEKMACLLSKYFSKNHERLYAIVKEETWWKGLRSF